MTDKDDSDSISVNWSSDDVNMSTTGFIAQEIGTIDLGNISITTDTLNPSYYSIGSSNSTISISPYNSDEINTSYIQTPKHRIDLDKLAEVFETVKKRLLILTPNFEMHEKYPMLKQMYDEYKAMEKLLSGPDSNE